MEHESRTVTVHELEPYWQIPRTEPARMVFAYDVDAAGRRCSVALDGEQAIAMRSTLGRGEPVTTDVAAWRVVYGHELADAVSDRLEAGFKAARDA